MIANPFKISAFGYTRRTAAISLLELPDGQVPEASTTMEVDMQFNSESQRKVVDGFVN